MRPFTAAFALWFIAGCGGSPIQNGNESDFTQYSSIARAIGEAGEPVLHEGLPHPMFEAGHFERERKRDDIHEWNGHWFYNEKLPIDKKTAVELTKLVTENGTFVAFSGEKKCGGFHPDFALEWTDEGNQFACFLCFGCREAMLFSPQSVLRCDMTKSSAERLKTLLTVRKNRPGERDLILIK